MADLEEAEKRIVELCERAEAKGWVFGPCSYSVDSTPCGCVLEACAVVLGRNKSQWTDIADELGLDESGGGFGGHFDCVARGISVADRNDEEELATRLAIRFVHKEGAKS